MKCKKQHGRHLGKRTTKAIHVNCHHMITNCSPMDDVCILYTVIYPYTHICRISYSSFFIFRKWEVTMAKARRGAESMRETEIVIRNQSQSHPRAVMRGHQGN